MKNFFYSCFLLMVGVLSVKAQNIPALLPLPNCILQTGGNLFNPAKTGTSIYANTPDLAFEVQVLQRIFKKRMDLKIPRSSSAKANINLLIDPEIEGGEHYVLTIDEKGLTIKGSTPASVYYGVMTVDQLLLGNSCHTADRVMESVYIDDMPRFSYRALMLDPARHFLPVEDVKFFIDKMSYYKFNVLQLHLTDDQGWRIEIKKHPELTGKEYYTQEQLKDLVSYAEKRHITLVPELDMPGHTVSILAAHPELCCTSMDTVPKIVGKTVDMMLCAANEKVYAIYKDIINEVASIFPSRYIHLGGDESVIKNNWNKCSRCTAMMKDLGYQEPSQLMLPFFNRMLEFVSQNGKELILWCELNNIRVPADKYLFPYPEGVTLVGWRNGLTPSCQKITSRKGHKLIMAPGEYAYLDYPQLQGDFPELNNWGMPVTTLEKSYRFDPGYGAALKEQSHILGIMGTLWGEAIKDINRLTYMAYPRALALAEAGWTKMEYRDWESFKERLYPNLMNLMKQGVSVRVPFEIAVREE